MADEKDLEIAQQLNEVLQKSTELAAIKATEEGKSLSRREKELDLLSRREQLIRQANDLLNVKIKNLDKVQESLERELEREKLKGEIDEENFQKRREFIKVIAEARKKDTAQAQVEIEKIIKALERQNEQQKKNAQAFEAGQEAAGALVGKLGQLAGLGGPVGQSLKKIGQSISGADGLKNATLGLGKGLVSSAKEMFSFSNMAGMVVENTLEQAVTFDILRARVAALTGGQAELAQQAVETAKAMADQNVLFEEAAEANVTLFREFGKFTSLQPQVQGQLNKTAIQLQRLGIAPSETADALNTLVTGLGLTAPEANEKIIDLVESSSELQIGPDQLMRSLISLKAPLADFGRKGPDVFMRMAKEAKRLGLETESFGQTLFSLSDSVDTFSEAAQVAATFQTLGLGAINVQELVMAAAEGPEVVRDVIQSSFDSVGKSFSDLGILERKALGAALPISSEELEALFGEVQKSAELVTAEEKSLTEQVENATTAAQKQKRAFQDLAGPIKEAADALNMAAETFQETANFLGPGGALAVGGGVSALSTIADVATTGLAVKGLGGLFKMGDVKPDLTPGDVQGGLSKGAAKGGVKAGTKTGLKGLGMFAKKIPIVGILAGLGFGLSRLLEGDIAGAGLEVASGAASTLPGAGTAASVGIDAALMARDAGAFTEATGPDMMQQQMIARQNFQRPAATGITPMEMEMAVKNALKSAGGSEQPIKVELYLDKSGTNKIAETTVKYIDRNYTMHNNSRVPI